jgi:hypothetical protein
MGDFKAFVTLVKNQSNHCVKLKLNVPMAIRTGRGYALSSREITEVRSDYLACTSLRGRDVLYRIGTARDVCPPSVSVDI